MKQLTLTLLAICTLFSCSKDEPVISTEQEDYYNCDNFFDSGTYSNFCTIETNLPNILESTIDGGGTVCRYIIPAIDTEHQVNSSVSFVSLQTSDQARTSMESRIEQFSAEAEEDEQQFFTLITINNYEGYIYEGQYANYSKSITVRYKNVFVTTAAVYYKNWYPETPCSYETEELTKLLSNVLDNM